MAENPSEKLYKIINDPAADNSVKCHQGNVAKQTEPAENPPFLSWLFQLTVHEKGTCLSRSSNGKFQHKSRDSQDDQTQKIDQHKAAAAILPAHPREFPHISAANGTAGGKHNEAKPASKLFTFHKITLPSEVHIRDIIR